MYILLSITSVVLSPTYVHVLSPTRTVSLLRGEIMLPQCITKYRLRKSLLKENTKWEKWQQDEY